MPGCQRHVTSESIECFNQLAETGLGIAEFALLLTAVWLAWSLLLILLFVEVFK